MNLRIPHVPSKVIGWLIAIAVIATGFLSRGTWIPATETWVKNTINHFRGNTSEANESDTEDDAHMGHDHSSGDSLDLSAQARRNIGLTDDMLGEVRLQTFRRSITVPAMVVERPGRTLIQVATPMTGVITHVHAVTGESVESGTLLFEIRLTHEDLVQAQTEFLKTIGELQVEHREIARLSDVTKSGAVAPIKRIEREYARDKLQAILRAQEEGLRLHGLSESQVQHIATDQRLLRDLQVVVPFPDQHTHDELKLTQLRVHQTSFQPGQAPAEAKPKPSVPLIISELNVHKGQAVIAGETLCVLSDMRQLYIEGHAFEQDAAILELAANNNWPITAIQPSHDQSVKPVENLRVTFLDNRVNTETRALKFYVGLPNTIVRTTQSEDGQRFIGWKYKPGQRMQLRIPVEEWTDRIVLPIDAVSKEGADYFVFMENGKHFDRKAVHVEYRDQFNVVVANDGSLFEGDVVALTGAHQMQMALKNKSGGAVDPHAGHNH